MTQELQKALRLVIDFSYEQSLKEYLSANILANEIDFINYITNNLKETINDLKPQIDFFFNDKIDTEEEYLNLRKRDNYWFFIEYQKYIDEKKRVLNKEASQPHHEPAPEVEKLQGLKNNFDTLPIKDVYDYFKTNLVDKKRLSEDDLIKYLKQAFDEQKPPKKKIELKYNTKQEITRVFYNYYKIEKTYGQQQKYVDLLKLYFIGFERLTTTNFNK